MDAHLVIYTIDVSAMLLIAVIGMHFVTSHAQNLVARLWALICFNTICFILFSRYILGDSVPAPYQIDLGWFLFLARWAMNFTPGLFMMLAFFLFEDRRRFPLWLLVLFALQVLLEEPVPLALVIEPAQGDLLFEVIPAVLQMTFTGFAIYWALRQWQADTVDERRWLRLIFLGVVGVFIVVSVLMGRILVAAGVVSLLASHVLLNVVCLTIGLSAIFSIFHRGLQAFTEPGRKNAALDQQPRERAPSTHDLQAIRKAFDVDHIYTEAGLTIGSLSAKLKVPEYRLRKLIHQTLGFRNFNALIHHYRIKEMKERLISDEERSVPILTLALSVGYQSINPFNRAFREQEGMSPSEYRASALAAREGRVDGAAPQKERVES